ncbi:MAG: hypothetical protein ABSE91_04160 [Patescibacteria group bacterium]|jgi:hypothetical protein
MSRKQTRRERGKLPLKILAAQPVIPKLGFRQPRVPVKFVLFDAEAEMTVIGFNHAVSAKESRADFLWQYRQKFHGEPKPDVTPIEETVFQPSFRQKIRLGMYYRDIPKA